MFARPGRLRHFVIVAASTGGCHSAKRHAETVSDLNTTLTDPEVSSTHYDTLVLWAFLYIL